MLQWKRVFVIFEKHERKQSVSDETMKVRNSEMIEKLRGTFWNIDTSAWKEVEKLLLCVMVWLRQEKSEKEQKVGSG